MNYKLQYSSLVILDHDVYTCFISVNLLFTSMVLGQGMLMVDISKVSVMTVVFK